MRKKRDKGKGKAGVGQNRGEERQSTILDYVKKKLNMPELLLATNISEVGTKRKGRRHCTREDLEPKMLRCPAREQAIMGRGARNRFH